jgi:two-component system NtrC family sensor kinase
MTALPPDVVTDLSRLIAELEQRLESSFAAHDEAIAQQAATARENARLRAELAIAQEREAASADILRTISDMSGDAERSLPQITEITARLFGASSVRIRLVEDGEWSSTYYFGRSSEAIRSTVPDAKARVGGRNLPGTVVAENRQIHIPDLDNIDPEMADWPGLPPARAAGARTVSGTPLRRDGKAIGVLLIHRDHLQPFSERELALQQNFADQAAIAVENSRLFGETRESLEQQRAAAAILSAINNAGGDLGPVFDCILENAHHLCNAPCGSLQLYEGDRVVAVATRGLTAPFAEFQRAGYPITEGIRNGLLASEPVQRVDLAELIQTIPDAPALRAAVELGGIRTMVTVPLAKDGVTFGRIVAGRQEVHPFEHKQIALLQSFAAQAVIAIENARLFNETREALERQTATADILKVIASSPSNIQPVFEAIATSANRLIGGLSTAVFSIFDEAVHLSAFTPTSPAADAALQSSFPRPLTEQAWAEAIRDGEIFHIRDVGIEWAAQPAMREIARMRGYRSLLVVPLLHDGKAIGTINVSRTEPGEFAAHHVRLLQTFADQAVIAIENVRLFDEVQARTQDLSESLQQQTATADVLKVISRSTFDLQTVLETLITSAVELSGANRGSIFLREGDVFPLKAASSTTPEFLQYWAANPPRSGRGSATARVIASGKVETIPDVLEDPEMQMTAGSLVRIRAALGVPMLRDNKVEGVLVLTRPEPGPFTKSQIDLVQTFADQAVIAVENVRLFDETQARTRELAASLDELRTAQDRLVQTEKLASLGQLTAGIAHEIKNPLNFVNNFAALSAELTDELHDLLKPAPLDDKIRDEVEELTSMLKGNLEKVVQHGKRADSIVKNMLLHSREGSGDHRPADINALLDESLNLAYHGARAEKPQFNVTLQRNFDPNAGMIEMFPQEITRVFLNLIANGFYAVNKRKTENGADFEPVVSATTTDRGNHVEIRIRDNGTGIPDEVKEKMFNPFFTTKPAGEGTGLGLSMSHDIIVKQHGGTIDVATEPGQFTEFIVVLPRTSNPPSKT